MNNEKFFAVIEKKLQVNISRKIKSHLKFHNMDNCKMACTLSELSIRYMEKFARSTLHKLLHPNDMLHFYGSHFMEKPKLFVFTLGERKHLYDIKEACKEMQERRRNSSDIHEVKSDSKVSTKKQTQNCSGHVDNTNQYTAVDKYRKKGEVDRKPSKSCSCNKCVTPRFHQEGTTPTRPRSENPNMSRCVASNAIRIENSSEYTTEQQLQDRMRHFYPGRKLSGRADKTKQYITVKKEPEKRGASTEPSKSVGGIKCIPSRFHREEAKPSRTHSNIGRCDDTNAIRITNFSEDTTEQQLRDLIRNFDPIRKFFFAKDKDFGYIDFKYRKDAAMAIQLLNGIRLNGSILAVDWSEPAAHNN